MAAKKKTAAPTAGDLAQLPRMGRHLMKIRAGGHCPMTRVFPPPAAALLMAGVAAPPPTATFSVQYNGFSDEAKTAFQAAVDVWSVMITCNVTIRVDATWMPLGPGILGSAGPETFLRNFPSAPQANTWYPIALASSLAGSDLTPGDPHISANFNSVFSNWYLGTDGLTPPNRYDLTSVVLHELGHGLGFVGSMNVASDGTGSWGLNTGFPIIYDRFAENALGQSLLDTSEFPNHSEELAGQLHSNQLFFTGTRARTANTNVPVQLYAPILWDEGSSFSHLNEVTFPSGNPNSLMTPQIGLGESIHSPGTVGLGVLQDLGW
jgi:hypothetical protein